MADDKVTLLVQLKDAVTASSKKINGALGVLKNNWLAVTATIGAVVLSVLKFNKAASNLQETQAKFDTVFRGNTREAEGFAKVLTQSFLLSENSAKSYLASIQDTLVPMGIARKEAGNLSFEIVKLAADLGSFNNLPTETVVRDLQSALVGNTETVKKYGVVLKATDIVQVALAESGKKIASELTQAEKVTAAYKLVLNGTKDAQGDVARTGGSFANLTKKLNARIEDLQASIGKLVIGPMSNLVKVLISVAENAKIVFDTFGLLEKRFKLISAATDTTKIATTGLNDALLKLSFRIYEDLKAHGKNNKALGEGEKSSNLYGVAIGYLEKALIASNLVSKETINLLKEKTKSFGEVKISAEEEADAVLRGEKAKQAAIAEAMEEKRIAREEEKQQLLLDAEEIGLSEEEQEARKQLLKDQSAEKEAKRIADGLKEHGKGKKAELLLTKFYANKEKMALDKKHAEDQARREKNISLVGQAGAFISSLATSKNKQLAAIGKAGAIAAATADTYAAANSALRVPPPPVGMALAALVTAAGLANVAKIQGVNFAEGGVVLPTNGGTNAVIGEAGRKEAVIPLNDPRTKRLLGDTLGGGSGVNIGDININIDFDKLSIDNIDNVMDEISGRVKDGTIQAIEMAVALKNSSDKHGTLAT